MPHSGVLEAAVEGVETAEESEKGNDTSEVENYEQECVNQMNSKYNNKERKDKPRGDETEEDTNYANYAKRWDKNKKDIIVGHRLWRWQIEINI